MSAQSMITYEHIQEFDTVLGSLRLSKYHFVGTEESHMQVMIKACDVNKLKNKLESINPQKAYRIRIFPCSLPENAHNLTVDIWTWIGYNMYKLS